MYLKFFYWSIDDLQCCVSHGKFCDGIFYEYLKNANIYTYLILNAGMIGSVSILAPSPL